MKCVATFPLLPLSPACAGLTYHVLCFIKPTPAGMELREWVHNLLNLAKNLLDFKGQDR
jgi:hypothetical protein